MNVYFHTYIFPYGTSIQGSPCTIMNVHSRYTCQRRCLQRRFAAVAAVVPFSWTCRSRPFSVGAASPPDARRAREAASPPVAWWSMWAARPPFWVGATLTNRTVITRPYNLWVGARLTRLCTRPAQVKSGVSRLSTFAPLHCTHRLARMRHYAPPRRVVRGAYSFADDATLRFGNWCSN